MKNNRKHEYLIRVDKTKPREYKQKSWLQFFVIGFVLWSLLSSFLSPLVSVYAANESASSDTAITDKDTNLSSTTTNSSDPGTDTTATTDGSSSTPDSSEAIVSPLSFDDLTTTDLASKPIVSWSQTAPDVAAKTKVYPTNFTIKLKSIKDGRTFTWKAGDVITLPALTYNGKMLGRVHYRYQEEQNL